MTNRPLVGFYFAADFIVTIAVIATVVTLIVSTIKESRKSVEVAAASAEVMGLYRAPLSTYYAVNGEWPMTIEELQEMFPEKVDKMTYTMARNVRIAEGAITVDLRRQLSGETLTLHAAIPAQDSLGPVKWVAGPKRFEPGWAMIGEDRTTVDDKYIARTLKR